MDFIQIYEHVERIMQVQAPMPVIEIAARPASYTPKSPFIPAKVVVRFSACIEMDLVHEFSHHLAIKGGKLAGVPNWNVKYVLEAIALDVEKEYGDTVRYMPNCVSR